ncbi:MAG: beta-ketoacyl synthase N-terminal-like domain-containing protein, partial [Acetobacteraceae bacterium]
MRRVVVTGMGLVCPLGLGVDHVWHRLISGESGITAVNTFNNHNLPSRIAGQVPQGSWQEHCFDFQEWSAEELGQDTPRFIQLALVAVAQAVAAANWRPNCEEDRAMTGICIGSGCGGLGTLHEAAILSQEGTGRHPRMSLLQSAMIHQVASDIAARFGFTGPRRVLSTACASGVHAIGDAVRMIMMGDADVMIAGGTEAAVCELGMAG